MNLNLAGNKLNPLCIGCIFRVLMELSGYAILILIKATMWVFTIWQSKTKTTTYKKKTNRFHFLISQEKETFYSLSRLANFTSHYFKWILEKRGRREDSPLTIKLIFQVQLKCSLCPLVIYIVMGEKLLRNVS